MDTPKRVDKKVPVLDLIKDFLFIFKLSWVTYLFLKKPKPRLKPRPKTRLKSRQASPSPKPKAMPKPKVKPKPKKKRVIRKPRKVKKLPQKPKKPVNAEPPKLPPKKKKGFSVNINATLNSGAGVAVPTVEGEGNVTADASDPTLKPGTKKDGRGGTKEGTGKSDATQED